MLSSTCSPCVSSPASSTTPTLFARTSSPQRSRRSSTPSRHATSPATSSSSHSTTSTLRSKKLPSHQTGYTEKQHFLNTVYENFFQGFDRKQADTHGIVYTPQPIVDFMVRSVEEILQAEFGRSLSDTGVHILDPFVGTGNFIIRIMQQIKRTALPYKYAEELHCNEVMLLPYYIASMNIEHAYFERTGEYSPFEGFVLWIPLN